MSTDRPPPDDAAERMRTIAVRARRASTKVTELARLCALEILAFAGQDEDSIAKLVRPYLDRAVDAAAAWHATQLEELVEELADARRLAERLRAEAQSLKAQLRLRLRGRSDGR